MTYLRMHIGHSKQPDSVRTVPEAKATVDIEPAQDPHPRMAAVTIRPKRVVAAQVIANALDPLTYTQSGTLHKPAPAPAKGNALIRDRSPTEGGFNG